MSEEEVKKEEPKKEANPAKTEGKPAAEEKTKGPAAESATPGEKAEGAVKKAKGKKKSA